MECANSKKFIAYVTKYVNKGFDRVLFKKREEGGKVDELKTVKKQGS